MRCDCHGANIADFRAKRNRAPIPQFFPSRRCRRRLAFASMVSTAAERKLTMFDHISIGVRDIGARAAFTTPAHDRSARPASAKAKRRWVMDRRQRRRSGSASCRTRRCRQGSNVRAASSASPRRRAAASMNSMRRRMANGGARQWQSGLARNDYGPQYYAAFRHRSLTAIVWKPIADAPAASRSQRRRPRLDQRAQRQQRRRIGDAVDARRAEVTLERRDDVARGVVIGAGVGDAVAVAAQGALQARHRLAAVAGMERRRRRD